MRINLEGQKVGRLLIKEYYGPPLSKWKCLCDCGNEKYVDTASLRLFTTRSCSCLQKEEAGRISKLTAKKRKGKVRSDEFKLRQKVYALLLVALGTKFGGKDKGKKHSPHSPEGRERNRQSILATILSGRYSPHENRYKSSHKLQTIKGGIISYQSSWEVILCRYLDKNTSVTKFEKDKVRLPYFYVKDRIYIVDFLVTYENQRQELVEVKPKDLLTKEENPAKFVVAQKWCEERNIDFVIITEDEINLITALRR